MLHAVAEAGGIMAAGRRLNLVPSGFSAHMAALERETGVVVAGPVPPTSPARSPSSETVTKRRRLPTA